jgi:NADPH-dependent 2,4-dienoyl-CoA reductase/sulfur reductase-like enzyme
MSIFHPDFKLKPYWWEAYAPQALPEIPLPKKVAVLVVGAGYAGLSAARELARNGVEVLVIDSGEPGFGASTQCGQGLPQKTIVARRGQAIPE